MAYQPRRLLHDGLLAAAADPELAEKEALVAEGKSYTYHELYEAALGVAGAMQARGVQRGDRVAVYMDNTWPCVVSIYAASIAGAAFLVINPQTKADKLAYILADSGASLLATDGHLAEQFEAALSRLEHKPVVLCSGKLPESVAVTSFDAACVHRPAQPAATIPLDLAALIYTSGSTGEPKGVMQTHQAMVFSIISLCEYLRFDDGERILCALPLSFDYGLYQLLMSVWLGATLVLERSFAYPAQIFERMHEQRVTAFPGVPTMFVMLLASHARDPLSFPEVRTLTNTAAALPDEVALRLREVFPNALIFKMYGLTECKRVAYLEPELMESKPGSVGKAIPGTEVFLRSEAGDPVLPGATGVLYVRGPHVMLGYWRREEDTARMLVPGPLPNQPVLCTGDRFRIDADGFLYFVGRSDDIIKTRGEKVSPAEIENVLHTLAGVREAAVIGVADGMLGEAIRAYVVADPAADLDARRVRAHCAALLENFMVPRDIAFVAELPSTDTGKVSKRLLREAAAGTTHEQQDTLYASPTSPVRARPVQASAMTGADREEFRALCERLAAGLELLPDMPEETVDSSARALWHTAAGRPVSAAAAAEASLPHLDAEGRGKLDGLIARRLGGVPLAHLTGRQRFCGLEMLASPAALVPRRETELLTRAAVRLAQRIAADHGILRVIDVCTGAGNVALAIASEVPEARIDASDLEPAAIEFAQRNAEHLGLAERVRFTTGDLLDTFAGGELDGCIDLITCNPPYISSKRVDSMAVENSREPRAAFDGGPFGVSILMRLVADAPRLLRTGAWLAFEVGLGQGPPMVKRLERDPAFEQIEGVLDASGAIRAVLACRKEEKPATLSIR